MNKILTRNIILILKNIFLLFFILSILFDNSCFSHNRFNNIIKNDTIWYSDTININNDISIDSNTTLIILPGTYIEFQGYYKMEIYGKILAIGNINDSITFTINDTLHFSDTSMRVGGWNGIHLIHGNDNDTSIFDYCNLKYGKAVVKVPWWYHYNKEGYGGLIFAHAYHALIITHSNITNNLAKDIGGAIYANYVDYFYAGSNSFSYNNCLNIGGCIYYYSSDGSAIIENNIFTYNKAHYYSNYGESGGGSCVFVKYPYSGFLKIINNKMFNNKSLNGVIYENSFGAIVNNNTICNNYGMSIVSGNFMSNSVYANNTISNNYRFLGCSGIFCNSHNLKIINNIIWNNTNGMGETTQIDFYEDDPIVNYNCVHYGYEGEGNIDSLPMFVNPTAGAGLAYNGADADWSLLVESPCINAGTPDTSGLFLPDYDIEGNPRICGFRIDMGAYENQVFALTKPVLRENNFSSVYPNPGQNNLFVKTELKNLTFELIDFTGKIIIRKSLNSLTQQINTSNIPSGMYFYRIHNKSGIIETGKWIKR